MVVKRMSIIVACMLLCTLCILPTILGEGTNFDTLNHNDIMTLALLMVSSFLSWSSFCLFMFVCRKSETDKSLRILHRLRLNEINICNEKYKYDDYQFIDISNLFILSTFEYFCHLFIETSDHKSDIQVTPGTSKLIFVPISNIGTVATLAKPSLGPTK